jgi:hypothetical protein
MWARTKSFVLIFTAIASLDFIGCTGGGGGSQTSNPTPAIHNQWTWEGGANVPDQGGTYGTQGVAAPGNVPSAREQAVSWTDPSGNFWLFGGWGYAEAVPLATSNNILVLDSYGLLNDLWKYSGGQWTWVGGSNLGDQPGIYGILGTPSPNNVPTGRYAATRWVDMSGNLWLFGGASYTFDGSTPDFNSLNHLNDLWKYTAGQWTWMQGSSVGNQSGNYGTQGTSAVTNTPGGRFNAMSWTGPTGDLWLFGGDALDSTGAPGYLNDLWKYSAGQWTWMQGSNVGLQPGVYGTQGTASATNVPGGREQSFTWTDASGNFWLFGGNGYDSQGNRGFLNDLWKYSNGQWTWVAGSNLINQPGVYGTQGMASPDNVPRARNSGVSWVDASGNLWLFGGGAYNSSGSTDYLDDVWKFSAGQWTWVAGSNAADQQGTYGILGTPAASNIPEARFHEVNWTDASGKLWLFGGKTPAATATQQAQGLGYFQNDLWSYQP